MNMKQVRRAEREHTSQENMESGTKEQGESKNIDG